MLARATIGSVLALLGAFAMTEAFAFAGAEEIAEPGPSVFHAPPLGGAVQGFSGTTDPAALVAAQSFAVLSVSVFDVRTQGFHIYIPGAPPGVSGLTSSNLTPQSIVWLRRSSGDIPTADVPPAEIRLFLAEVPLLAPDPGGVTQGSASLSDPALLVDLLPFAVESLSTFDFETQSFLVYVPGAPPMVNTLTADTLDPSNIVWVRRAKSDETLTPTPTPIPTQHFATLAPRSQLPSGAVCASLVRPTAESMPENMKANATRGSGGAVLIDGASNDFNSDHSWRIDGDYVGTTDEILQWASCKWGFDEDLTRARAWVESSWRQSFLGDLTGDSRSCETLGLQAPCAQSFGILQVKGTVHQGTYPTAERSTAFGADYALAWLRACYEGDFAWMTDYTFDGHDYRAGDLDGCVGAWNTGDWYSDSAQEYVGWGNAALINRPWE